MMKKIIGIDASSTTIGICVIEYDDTQILLKYTEYFKPSKQLSILKKLLSIRLFIKDLIRRFNPDEIALEDILLFMSKKSNATTIITLAIVNRIIGTEILDITGVEPYLYNVRSIRKIINNTPNKIEKKDIPDLVASILNIKFPYLLNRKKNIIKENYDIADSIAVALCHIFLTRKKKNDKK